MFNSNWHPKEELCGYITESGQVVQLENLAENKETSFSIDVTKLPGDVAILWHSHPSNLDNLSVDDYLNFLQFPDYTHRIYAKDSYADYYVRNNMVFRVE